MSLVKLLVAYKFFKDIILSGFIGTRERNCTLDIFFLHPKLTKALNDVLSTLLLQKIDLEGKKEYGQAIRKIF